MRWILSHSRQSHCLRSCLLGIMIAGCIAPRGVAAQETSSDSDSPAAASAEESATASTEGTPDAEQGPQAPTLSIGEKSPEPAIDKGGPADKTQRTAGYIVGGVGIVGLAVGTIFGFRVLSKNDDSESICPTGQLCSPRDQARYHQTVDDARSARTVALLGLGLGGAAVVTGAALVLTAPKDKPAVVSFVPTLGIGRVGASLQGAW
jgi:hypothetical protein